MSLALGFGAAVALALPSSYAWVTRGLIGWNIAVWSYLVFAAVLMARADHERMRRVALAQAEGALAVLALAVSAAVASLVGVIVEMALAKAPENGHGLLHTSLALLTVGGGWLFLPILFTLTYASEYFDKPNGRGLKFPDEHTEFRPKYIDFLYFSFTIAVACQTSDVCVTSTAMRKLVILQSVLSFVFNTAIFAFTINIAAGMF